MALASPPSTPPGSDLTRVPSHLAAPSTTFDVAAHYDNLIKSDLTLPPPIAAIESLIALLTHTQLTTVSETLSLLSHQCHVLLRAQLNPIPLSAGTDLFQRYLISAFQQRSAAHTDFSTLRAKLVSNSKLFVTRAKTASKTVATNFLPFVSEECTIFTYGKAHLLSTITQHAIDKSRYFTLVNLTSQLNTSPPAKPSPVPVSTISLSSFPSAISTLTQAQSQSAILLITCDAVFSNGSLLAPFGTRLLTSFAATTGIPVYCCAESFKFVRSFPLGTSAAELRRMGVKQDILRLRGGVPDAEDAKDEKVIDKEEEMVEIVPAEQIAALVTENGIITPSAVSEELIKLWF